MKSDFNAEFYVFQISGRDYDEYAQEILSELEFEVLLQISNMNQDFADLAVEVFRRRFAKKQFVIDGSEILEQTTEMIRLHKIDNLIRTLKLFGQHISSMSVYYYYFDMKYANLVNRLINECGSKTLVSLHLYVCEENTLNEMTLPFEAVEELTFAVKSSEMNSEIRPFNVLFPKLRRLSLQNFVTLNGSYADCELPHLEHLYLFWRREFPVFGSTFEMVIRQNPHLRSLETYYVPGEFLSWAGENLPNLEILEIYTLNLRQFAMVDLETPKILFPTVKKLIARDAELGTLRFPQLQDLEITCDKKTFLDCIEFLENHSFIRRFYLLARADMHDDVFDEMKPSLQNLKQLYIYEAPLFNIENIVNYVQNHPNLNEVAFNFCRDPQKKILQDKLLDEWEFSLFDDCFLLTRKNKIL